MFNPKKRHMRLFYKWSTLRRCFKYSSPLLDLIEKPLLKKYGTTIPIYPAVFIIGAPRTGSTILYQLITQYLNVSYINNFINLGYKNLFLTSLLSEAIFNNRPHNSFHSQFGQTQKGGLNAPSESGLFWHRWIPKDVDFIPEEQAKNLSVGDLQQNIFSLINKFQRPLLFKNMNAGMRIALLEKLQSTNKYIFIKRDPVYVAQSIIQGRKKIFNDPDRWWSIKPPNYDSLKLLNYVEQVVKQVYSIDKQIYIDLNRYVNKQEVLTVNYENLTEVKPALEQIMEFIGGVENKLDIPNIQLDIRNDRKCDPLLFELIEEEVNKLDWNGYSSEV